MRLLIDADGCPVVDIAVRAAKRFGVECIILCDTAHEYDKEGAVTVFCAKGADSVDFKLVNLAEKGDIVVTQDYGLAAMCLARGVRIINQDGMEYTANNIDRLLHVRHLAKKERRAGGRIKGPPKRLKEQNISFENSLVRLLSDEQ